MAPDFISICVSQLNIQPAPNVTSIIAQSKDCDVQVWWIIFELIAYVNGCAGEFIDGTPLKAGSDRIVQIGYGAASVIGTNFNTNVTIINSVTGRNAGPGGNLVQFATWRKFVIQYYSVCRI